MSTYQNFQASIFGDFSIVDPINEHTQDLYRYFMNEKMFPSTRPAINAATQQIVNRPMFQNNIGTMIVSIGMDRIDVNAIAPSAATLIHKDDFINEVKKYCKYFTDVFKDIMMTRISFIANSMLEFVPDIKKDNFTNTYLKNFPTFNGNTIKEWAVNTVTAEEWSINQKTEGVNINITAHLQVFNVLQDGGLKTLNGVLLTKDLNTFGEKLIPRFDIDDIIAFFDKAGEKDEEIEGIFSRSEIDN